MNALIWLGQIVVLHGNRKYFCKHILFSISIVHTPCSKGYRKHLEFQSTYVIGQQTLQQRLNEPISQVGNEFIATCRLSFYITFTMKVFNFLLSTEVKLEGSIKFEIMFYWNWKLFPKEKCIMRNFQPIHNLQS